MNTSNSSSFRCLVVAAAVIMAGFIFLATPGKVQASGCSTQGNGNWSDKANWLCGATQRIPRSGDSVSISHAINLDTIQSGLTFTSINVTGTGSLLFSSSSSQALTASSSFSNSGTVTCQRADQIISAGSMINNRTFNAGPCQIYDAGDFQNDTGATFDFGTSTVTFNGDEAALSAFSNISFYDLIVDDTATLIETNQIGSVIYTHSLTNNGVIEKNMVWDGTTGSKTFGLAGYLPKGGNLAINVTTSGLDDVTVDRRDTKSPNANSKTNTGRYWTFTPTGSGYYADVTLPFASITTPYACRYTGTGTNWGCKNNNPNSNTVSFTSADSTLLPTQWAIGDAGTTAVNLNYFRSVKSPSGVQLEWETVSESSTSGFNLYRREPNGSFVKLNSSLIQPLSAGTPEGSAYTYVDNSAFPGKVYEYKLEVIETSLQVGSTALLTYWPFKVFLALVTH